MFSCRFITNTSFFKNGGFNKSENAKMVAGASAISGSFIFQSGTPNNGKKRKNNKNKTFVFSIISSLLI